MNRSKLLWACFTLVVVVMLAGHVNSRFPRVFLPYEFDYGEGIVLWQAQHIFQTEHAYSSLDQYPYIVYHYPPLYHVASRLLAATGLDLLTAGRLVSLLSAYGLVFFAGALVYQVTPRRWSQSARLLGASVLVLFLYRPNALGWATLMRVDFLALGLVALGLYFFVRSPMGQRSQYIGLVCFALALYTKQTYISAPVACLAAALWTDRRSGLRRLWFLTILGGAILLLFSWWTDWRFPRHLFLYTQYPYSVRKLLMMLVDNTYDLAGLLPLALGGIAIAVGRPRANWASSIRPKLRSQPFRRTLVILGIYATLTGLLSLTSGGAGSSVNYFLEFNLACTVLAALFVAWVCQQQVVERGPTSPLLVVGCGLLAVSVLPAGPDVLRLMSSSLTDHWREQTHQKDEFHKVVSFVRSLPGPVVANDMIILVVAGKEIPFEPIVVKFLSATNVWDETPIVQSISEQRYSAFILKGHRESFFSPAALSAMDSSYRETQQIGAYTVYQSVQ